MSARATLPPAAPTTVLLADDHAVVRVGFRHLLEEAGNIAVVAEACSGDEACRLAIEHVPAVVVMDVSLPGLGGIEATRQLVSHAPAVRVLMCSVHEDTAVVSRALEVGARGYVTKASAADVLVAAVQEVAAGRVYLSHDVAQALAAQRLLGPQQHLRSLSTRELQVFQLLAQGRTLDEIAALLSLTTKSVANYQSSIRQKLQISTGAQLIRIALSHGLIEPGSDQESAV
jgi:DNA-binding NarL/FixJ family response regulator